ncbi:MAG: VWA containing CoxE family protein, partial [Nitrobacter sp.]
MRENLHRFFRAARGAGVRVSPAESIDAMRAVAAIGFEDRGILRDTLLLTLAKTQDEKKALGACFDLFFARPQSSQAANENEAADNAEQAASEQSSSPSEQGTGAPTSTEDMSALGPLAEMLMSQDRNQIAAAIANAASSANLSDIRFFTQRGLFSSRILDELGIQRLRDDLDDLLASNPALAERLAMATERLRDDVRDTVSQALLLY